MWPGLSCFLKKGTAHSDVPEYAAPDPGLMEIAGVSLPPVYRSKNKPSFSIYSLPQRPEYQHIGDQATFGERITLVGYDTSMVQNEQSIQLFTVWRVDDALEADLASFVHWVDEDGSLISQHDGLDAAPETLQTGDLVVQRHILPITRSFPIGASSFHIGFYGREEGKRLLRNNESPVTTDRIIIPHDTVFGLN